MSTDMTICDWHDVNQYTVSNVSLDSYALEGEMAADHMTPIGSRTSITGTGLMSIEAWSALAPALRNESNRVKWVQMAHPQIAGDKLFDLQNVGSDIGGPFVKMSGTQVVGSTVVLVRFEITDRSAACNQPVTSHVWTQRMSVDASGYSTRTVQGTMTVARHCTETENALVLRDSTTWLTTLPWADIFRAAIVPKIIEAYGWRRESQEFAFEPTSLALTYTITDKQYAHNLPDGVRVGNMEFSYERTLDNPAIANCSFSCDLEADLSMRNLDFAGLTVPHPSGGSTKSTANRRLIEIAVQLSKERINATYGNCLVTRMRITERDMLSKFAIRFELDAQFRPDTATTGTALSAIAFMVGRGFKVRRYTSPEVSAFGSAARDYLDGEVSGQSKVWMMIPHYLDNYLCGDACATPEEQLPYANYVQYDTDDPELGQISVVQVEGNLGNASINAVVAGKYDGSQSQPASSGGFANIVSHSASLTQVRSDQGIARLSVLYRDAQDLIFQTRKPDVRIIERIEVVKLNTAPDRVVRPMATGAYLIRENWDVTFGRFDSGGNRLFTGIYEREYGLYDIGGDAADPAVTANGFYDYTGVAGPLTNDKIRAWRAPMGYVAPTISPVATTTTQGVSQNVFSIGAATTTDQLYPVEKITPAT